ncbi:amidohydrolase [Acinetobacter rongchengensis]|uniref:Amidohydrolase n=1 Tax=Acinetobacter rongchengensis TaxID=2419601 RepID=A0A3A8EVC6_9GAMM|nr:amidohydrolase [Acinetobacter rongchengensis]RKG38565.1 amidohydrolase [Acinetobacter rongchengensis]
MLLRLSELIPTAFPILSITSCVFITSCTTLPQYTTVQSQQTSQENTQITQASENILIRGGSILTMQGMTPHYVEALLVKDGRITFAGDLKQAKQRAPHNSQEIDLKHYTLLPGFIDAHSHLNSVGLQQTVANLYPEPDGDISDIPSLLNALSEWQQQNRAFVQATQGWIIGNGYDDAQLKEKRHPTADDLDKVSITQPIIILHQSGHLASVNHKALELLNIDKHTANPTGGIIRRKAGSQEPDGVLEEAAVFSAMATAFSKVPPEMMQNMAKTALNTYIKNGYTTVQEGRADAGTAELWRSFAEIGQLNIDVVVYPDLINEKAYMLKYGSSRQYQKHFRIGGVKISLDGSPQGKTAWLTKPYLIPPEGQNNNYRGYPAYPEQSTVQNAINLAYQHHWQILAHANGDAAIDQYLETIEVANQKFGQEDHRNVIIHAQTMREDQLDRAQHLGLIPSFFSLHTYYWGDWHKHETLGAERANRISPTGSALKRNLIFTEHHDAPVIPPKNMMVIDATVNRTTRTGEVLGQEQRVSPYIALKSVTDWAAYQYFEEKDKGTLEKGKLADFVVLDLDPLKVPSQQIKNIKILATYKEGQLIYQADNFKPNISVNPNATTK